jgi:hypothetical protein
VTVAAMSEKLMPSAIATPALKYRPPILPP